MFHGSYDPEDVTFLLKPLANPMLIGVDEKEALIQSGTRHYSEMLSPESLPSENYLQLFEKSLKENGRRMAWDALKLALLIQESRGEKITLVSLARAGTPVGVLLKRILQNTLGIPDVAHYSISIIRDRGIDTVALDTLRKTRTDESVVFIDGWTGKGVISRELDRSIARYNQARGASLDSGLWVLADLAGVATASSALDDYLIPSSILNATVSGLISRSILDDTIGDEDYHGCYYYKEFEPQDRSRAFIQVLEQHVQDLVDSGGGMAFSLPDLAIRNRAVKQLMGTLMRNYEVPDINLIKPGIGEATRVLLRRTPERVLVVDRQPEDLEHIHVLAREKGVPVEVVGDLGPYRAVSLIKGVLDA